MAGRNENGSLVEQCNAFVRHIFGTLCRAGACYHCHLQWKFHVFILQSQRQSLRTCS